MSVDFRFVDFNFPTKSNVALSASSEDVNFPAVNVGKEFRSKTWRSSGNFVIVAGTNDAIDFEEVSIGPELNATITAATYTPTTLSAAIKSALELVGAETYTVTYSTSTGMFTIASSGTHFELFFGTGTNIATSVHSDLGFADADLASALTYSSASIALHTVERIVIDLKTTEEIDTFALLFDPRLGINLSEEAVVKLQANHASSWDSPPVEITLTLDQEFAVFTHFFTTDQSFRFWSVEITDPRNPNLYVDLGTIVLGKSETLTRIPDNGFSYRKIDNSKAQRTDFQNVYIDEFSTNRQLNFNFGVMEYPQMQIMEQIFDRAGIRTPVFVALDAQAQLFDKDNIVVYGRMDKVMEFKHRVKDIFRTKMRITENF